jgi:hypothetical protein
VHELGITGVGQLAVGLAVLAAGLSATDIDAVRLIVPFAVVLLLVCGLSHYATRWMRRDDLPPVEPAATVEQPSDTTRRSLIGMAPAILAVLICTLIAPGLAVILGGVVAGVGLIDLRNRAWAQAREREDGVELLRQLGRSPFAAGRRPVYTRPRNARTLRT